jgi:hypothetical protein
VVEIGSFCGGSTAFLAEAMRLKAKPRSVFSVDPFMGAPVWFPRGYMHSTFDEFSRNMETLGLSAQVVPMRGESAAIAAIWPALPIDLLFIDGDHSLLGVISDFEKWAPKVRGGGLILIDDVDHIQEVEKFTAILSSLTGISVLETIDGIAVYRKSSYGADLIGELVTQLGAINIRRPWDYSGLSAAPTPKHFKTRTWSDPQHGLCYELLYFSVAESGDYGISGAASKGLGSVAKTVADDKGDGVPLRLPARDGARLRACCCTLPELDSCIPYLQPGAVVLVETADLPGTADAARSAFGKLGLEGFGFEPHGHVFWGVFRPESLSPDAIIRSHFRNAGLG